jgi:hypothetical protein
LVRVVGLERQVYGGGVSETVEYRAVFSREAAGWVVTVYGPDLPAVGVSDRRRTLAELHEAAGYLVPPKPGSSSTDIDYDFGPKLTPSSRRSGKPGPVTSQRRGSTPRPGTG